MPASPHDALFRYTFGRPEHVRGLLQAALPGMVLAGVDWSTLRAMPGTHVDERLRRQQSDLIFRVQRRGFETLVYVLIEHKVRPERWAVLQLLEYVLGLWRDLRKSQPSRRELPNVVPILLLQSAEGEAPESLGELMEDHLRDADLEPATVEENDAQLGEIELDMVQPQFEPFVVRLADLSLEQRRGIAWTVLAKMTVEALLHLPGADALRVAELFERWAPAVGRLACTPAGEAALRALWSYLAGVANVSTENLIRIVEQTMDPLANQKFKPPIEQWRDEGREQGLEQGREQGRVEILLRQLAARFGEVPAAVEQRVRTAHGQQLDDWAVRLLDAPAIADVFGDA